MFPVKHTVIYTFFAITSVQNTCFCSVFNALASKNTAKSCYVQCFFHFWPFFHCRKATKMTQNSISIPSCAQTPKNPRKMSKTPKCDSSGKSCGKDNAINATNAINHPQVPGLWLGSCFVYNPQSRLLNGIFYGIGFSTSYNVC